MRNSAVSSGMTWPCSLLQESWYSLPANLSLPDPSPPQEACSHAAAEFPPGQAMSIPLGSGCAMHRAPVPAALQPILHFAPRLHNCDRRPQSGKSQQKTPLQLAMFGPLMDPASQGPQVIQAHQNRSLSNR